MNFGRFTAREHRYIARPYVVVIAADQVTGRTRVHDYVSAPLLVRCLTCDRLASLEELVRGRCEDCQ